MALGSEVNSKTIGNQIYTDIVCIQVVMHHQRRDRELLPKEEQYIHKCSSEEGFDVIVMMLQGLAQYVHTASATLHDNKYARLHGNWKAWDAIIWLTGKNMCTCRSVLTCLYLFYYLTGICFARVYCTHETVEAFSFMWSA